MASKTNDHNPTTKTEGKTHKIQISDDVAAKLDEIDPDPNVALRKLLGCHDDRLDCAN